MATEKYESIIDVSYLGQRDVDKYISDLRRLGAITEQVERQLRAATAGGLGGSSDELGRALGVGAARMRDYDAGAARAIATTDGLARSTARLRAEVAKLNADLTRAASSGGGSNQSLRRGLYGALQTSAVNQRISAQTGVPLAPVGPDGRNRAPLALPAAPTIAEVERARLVRESSAALTAEIRARERATAAVRDAIPLGPVRAPLALPTGAGAGVTDAAEVLRARAAQARAAREEAVLASRGGRGQEAVDASFSPGGRLTGVAFEQGLSPASKQAADDFDRLSKEIRSLDDAIGEARRKFVENQRNKTAAGREVEELNRATYQARMTDAERRSAGGQNVNGYTDVMPDGNDQLWRYGKANVDALRELNSPEARNFLIGREGAGGDPLTEYAEQLRSKRDGIPVPGFANRDDILNEKAAAATAQDQERLDRLLRERAQVIEQLIAVERRGVAAARAQQGALGDVNPLRQPLALNRGTQERAATEAAAEAERVRQEAAAAEARTRAQASAALQAELRAKQIASMKADAAGGLPPGSPPPTANAGDGFEPSRDPRIQAAIDAIRSRDTASAATPVDRARAGVVAADKQLDDVLASLRKGFGNKGGFENQEALNAAYASAVKRGATAQEALNNAIQQEINRRLTTSQAYTAAVAQAARAEAANAQESLAQTAQRKLETAQLRQVDVAAKAEIPLGTPGGFRTEAGREAGVRSAQTAVETANRGLVAAIEAEKKAHEKAAAETRAAAERYTAAFKQAGIDNQQALAAARNTAAAAAAARNDAAVAASAPAPSRGGFVDDFKTGFVGEKNSASYAEQVGQTFKFSVLYGSAYQILSGITSTLQATLTEGIAFQQGMTDLAIATGQSKDALGDLATNVSAAAVAAGQAPSIGLEVGARAQGLYGVATGSGATIDEQSRVAQIAAEVVSQQALVSGLDPAEIQTQLAAVTNAFGLGIDGLRQVGDLDAFLTKQFGAPTGSTIQTVAESGSVASAAGYSLEEATSIAALVQARTGQSSSAVAGFLAQIFSREGEAQFGALAGRYGAEPTDNLSEKIELLARAYTTGSSTEQGEISAAFGRGKVQNAVVALLEGYSEVGTAAAAARGEAGGSLSDLADLRIGDIGGQLQVTLGVMKDFASALSDSGALEILGAGVLVFRELLETTTTFLRAWNELPGAVRGVIASLGLLAVATRTSAGRAVVDAVGGTIGTAAMRNASAAGGAGAARGALSAAAPFAAAAAAAGLAVLSAKLLDLSASIDTANESAEQALLGGGLAVDASPDQLRARAGELRATEEALPDYEGFSTVGRLKDLGAAAAATDANRTELNAEVERLEALAQANEAAAAASSSTETLVTGFDADSLSAAMDLVTRTGGTATEQFKALAAAISGGGDQAGRVAANFQPNLFSGNVADPALAALQDSFSLAGTGDVGFLEIAKGLLFSKDGSVDLAKDENVAPDLVSSAISAGDLQKRFATQLQSVTDLTTLSPEQLREIAAGVVGDLPSQVLEGTDADSAANVDAVRQQMIDAVTGLLQSEADSLLQIADSTLGENQIVDTLASLQEVTAAARGQMAETDYDGKIKQAQQTLRQTLRLVARGAGEASANSLQAIANARMQLAQDQIAKLEALRAVAQRNAENEKQFRDIGRDFLGREISAAVRGGDQDSLATLIEQGGEIAVSLARDSINKALETTRAAMKVQKVLADTAAQLREKIAAMQESGLAGDLPSLLGGPILDGPLPKPGDKPKRGTAEQRDYIKDLKGLETTLDTSAPALPGESDFLNTTRFDEEEKAKEERETAAERRAALAAAMAVRSESPIQQARASILSARAALAKADEGTVEYYNALGELYGAQNDLTDAVLAYQQNRYLLGIDLTNPLEQAKAELKAAEDKLRSDAGKGDDVLTEDRLAVQNAQNALESTKFQQRLDTVQTAERLGRISHGAYIRYLENEQRRLESIKNRTYQQQQQLNEIDGLLQDVAKEMQGQFNLGNINLPTPYEVRRYIEQSSGAMSARALASTSVQSSQTTIYIDGADTAKVRRIVEDVTGRKARTTTTAPRRR